MFFALRWFYLQTSREVKRIEVSAGAAHEHRLILCGYVFFIARYDGHDDERLARYDGHNNELSSLRYVHLSALNAYSSLGLTARVEGTIELKVVMAASPLFPLVLCRAQRDHPCTRISP